MDVMGFINQLENEAGYTLDPNYSLLNLNNVQFNSNDILTGETDNNSQNYFNNTRKEGNCGNSIFWGKKQKFNIFLGVNSTNFSKIQLSLL